MEEVAIILCGGVFIYGLAVHRNETIILASLLVVILGATSLFSLTRQPIATLEIIDEEGLDDFEIDSVTSLNEAQNFTLTFDDGVHIETTPVILEYLKKFKIKNAIFFIRGDRVKENPDLVKKIVDYGYKIGYHSMQHTNQAKMTELEINDDIKAFKSLIKGILPDYKLELARPPYGGMTKETVKIFNQMEVSNELSGQFVDINYLNKKLIAPHILKAYSNNGLKTLLWNIDFKDWEKRISVFYAARKFRKDLHQYWLFHEMPINKGTVFDNKITKDLPEFLMFILNPNKSLKELDVSVVSNPSEKLRTKATRIANQFNIDPKLFHALIKQESRWRKSIRSPKGATGLTQVMPFNATLCTKEKLTEEEQVEWLMNTDNNLFCGAKILKSELVYWDRKYPDNRELAIKSALGSYNAGRHAVENRNALTAFRETRNYVAIIWENYNG